MQKEVKDEEPLIKKSETVKEIQYYDYLISTLYKNIYREAQKKKLADRNKILKDQIIELTSKKEEIFNSKNKYRKNSNKKPEEKKADAPTDAEFNELEKEFKALQAQNMKINNKISLIKSSLNMDNLTRLLFLSKRIMIIFFIEKDAVIWKTN